MSSAVKKIFFFLLLLIVAFFLFGYFKNNSDNNSTNSMTKNCKAFSIKVDQKSKKKIKIIVYTLSNTSTFGLAFKSNYLKRIGKEVDDKVPSPLTFLAVIFLDSKLVEDMRKIQKSSFKYNNFCEGLYTNMMRLAKDKECLRKQIEEFSKELNINSKKTFIVVETCAGDGLYGDKDAFRPFVDYLIKEKSEKSR